MMHHITSRHNRVYYRLLSLLLLFHPKHLPSNLDVGVLVLGRPEDICNLLLDLFTARCRDLVVRVVGADSGVGVGSSNSGSVGAVGAVVGASKTCAGTSVGVGRASKTVVVVATGQTVVVVVVASQAGTVGVGSSETRVVVVVTGQSGTVVGTSETRSVSVCPGTGKTASETTARVVVVVTASQAVVVVRPLE
jgi:hypothetical protein